MLYLRSFTCKYDRLTLFENIDLLIDTHVTLLGANGSGKSSLAKAISSLIEYKGSIFLDGVNLKDIDIKQRARDIFYAPAKLDIYDETISVYEFVLLSRFAHKEFFFEYSKSDKTLALEALEALDIDHLKDHKLLSLSSGESALVLLASAICSQSKLLIFDEPTANLDPHNAKKIAQHLKALKSKAQIFLITHDLHLACYLQTNLLFLKDKEFKSFKNPKEFFNDEVLSELYGVEFKDLALVYG